VKRGLTRGNRPSTLKAAQGVELQHLIRSSLVLVAVLAWSSLAAADGEGKVLAAPEGKLTKLGKVDVRGRTFARAALERWHESYLDAAGVSLDRPKSAFDISVPSARLEARYQAPVRFVSAAVELEVTGKPELKDAWVRARGRLFGAQVGKFKVPFSAFELESRWDLPTASRGLLHDILVDRLEVAGRRPGVVLSARTPGKDHWSLTLGSFQGSILVERDGTEREAELFEKQTLRTQSLVARAELEHGDVTAGAGFEQRVGTPGVLRSERYFTVGGDVVLDSEYGGGGVRIWAEGLFGGSWFEHSRKPADAVDAVFASGRLMAAARFGGTKKGEVYVEPYGMVSLFDPDTVVAFDMASEQTLGVNVGFWNVARIGPEATLTHLERNFPRAYGLGVNPNRQTVLVQAGATF
jgi:hypothetical protein